MPAYDKKSQEELRLEDHQQQQPLFAPVGQFTACNANNGPVTSGPLGAFDFSGLPAAGTTGTSALVAVDDEEISMQHLLSSLQEAKATVLSFGPRVELPPEFEVPAKCQLLLKLIDQKRNIAEEAVRTLEGYITTRQHMKTLREKVASIAL
jgi:hypothetical protein